MIWRARRWTLASSSALVCPLVRLWCQAGQAHFRKHKIFDGSSWTFQLLQKQQPFCCLWRNGNGRDVVTPLQGRVDGDAQESVRCEGVFRGQTVQSKILRIRPWYDNTRSTALDTIMTAVFGSLPCGHLCLLLKFDWASWCRQSVNTTQWTIKTWHFIFDNKFG